MGTSASIIKENPDETFSSRFIHFDGYLSNGAGDLLQNHVNTSKKVDWLFGHNLSFRSLLQKFDSANIRKYKSCADKDLEKELKKDFNQAIYDVIKYRSPSVMEWPKEFNMNEPNSNNLMCLEFGRYYGVSSNESWKDIKKHLQGYDYMFDGEKWMVLCLYEERFSNSIFLSINDYQILQILDECPDNPDDAAEYLDNECSVTYKKMQNTVNKLCEKIGVSKTEQILMETFDCPQEILDVFIVQYNKHKLEKSLKDLPPKVSRIKKI